jgi:trk system potassium uptake protein TrkH
VAAGSLERQAAVPRPRFDLRPIGMAIGVLLTILAGAMVPPLVADLVAGNAEWLGFLLSGTVTLFTGVALILGNRTREPVELATRQVFLLTTAVWVAIAAFGALPFLLSGQDLSLADAFFESMSGITTTGATVMVGLDELPPGILLWRSMLQWLGGIGIIVMGVAILPLLSVGGMQLFRAESSDRSEKVLPRTAQIATAIGAVYLGLTALCAFAYWTFGMDLFDAVCHAMTTIATAGYSTRDSSLGAFPAPAIQWTAILFMIIGGIPFVLYIQALRGRRGPLLADVQVRWFLAIILVASALLAAYLHLRGILFGHDAVRHAMFTTVSVITGTGYASVDYGIWGTFPVAMIFFLMCVGGCTGSTTGGLKVFRLVVLYQVARWQMHRLLQPSAVYRMSYNRRPISEETAISVMAFFFVFALSFSATVVLLSLFGLDFLTAMSSALSALANVGPGLGPIVGPAGNFATLPEGAKWIMSLAMLLGRLELFTVLVLTTPWFWRH